MNTLPIMKLPGSLNNRAILEKRKINKKAPDNSFCVDKRRLPPKDVLDKAWKWAFKALASCPG